jgi:hypothetical protein
MASIALGYRLDNHGKFPADARDIPFLQMPQADSGAYPPSYQMCTWGTMSQEVTWPRGEPDRSLPSAMRVENDCICISAPTCAFLSCTKDLTLTPSSSNTSIAITTTLFKEAG